MSAMLSFSERKTFARCFDKSLVARLRCSSDLLGVGGAAFPLPKKYRVQPSIFGSPVYVRLAQFFRFVIPYNLSPFVGIFWAVCNRPVRC